MKETLKTLCFELNFIKDKAKKCIQKRQKIKKIRSRVILHQELIIHMFTLKRKF